jgi:hypothetical protein
VSTEVLLEYGSRDRDRRFPRWEVELRELIGVGDHLALDHIACAVRRDP